MNSKFKITLAVVAGAAIGAAAVQGLHAQAKPKAYHCHRKRHRRCRDSRCLWSAQPGSAKSSRWPQLPHNWKDNCGRGHAPKRVGLSEWDNLEQSQAWIASQGRNELNAERDKAIKIIRQYIVEAAN